MGIDCDCVTHTYFIIIYLLFVTEKDSFWRR